MLKLEGHCTSSLTIILWIVEEREEEGRERVGVEGEERGHTVTDTGASPILSPHISHLPLLV